MDTGLMTVSRLADTGCWISRRTEVDEVAIAASDPKGVSFQIERGIGGAVTNHRLLTALVLRASVTRTLAADTPSGSVAVPAFRPSVNAKTPARERTADHINPFGSDIFNDRI